MTSRRPVFRVPDCAIETFRGVVFPWQCDDMGHLATQHYMPLFDGAIFHLLGYLAPPTPTTGERSLGWADVRHAIDYVEELKSGDLVVLKSAVVKTGRSSVTHRTYVCRLPSLQVCCTLEAVTVRFDLQARVSTPLSPQIVEQARGLIVPATG